MKRATIAPWILFSLLVFLSLSFFNLSAHAASTPTESKDTKTDQLRHQFEERFPNTSITSFEASPVPGLYRVRGGNNTWYVDEQLEWLIVGDVYSLKTPTAGTPKTETRTEKTSLADPVKTADWASLPLQDAIVYNPTGKRAVAIWDDIDCPFCQKFHTDILPDLLKNDIAVYILLFPVPALHPDAEAKSMHVWCAEDRAIALSSAMRGDPVPAKTCEHPIKTLMTAGAKAGIRGTPTLHLDNNRIMLGARSSQDILKQLSQGQPVTTSTR